MDFRDLTIFMSYTGPMYMPRDKDFFHLKKRDIDFFYVSIYGTRTFFINIIFRKITKLSIEKCDHTGNLNST